MNMREQAEGTLLELQAVGTQLAGEASVFSGRHVRIITGAYRGREAIIKGSKMEVESTGGFRIYFWLVIPKANGEEGYVWGHNDARRAYAPEELELIQ